MHGTAVPAVFSPHGGDQTSIPGASRMNDEFSRFVSRSADEYVSRLIDGSYQPIRLPVGERNQREAEDQLVLAGWRRGLAVRYFERAGLLDLYFGNFLCRSSPQKWRSFSSLDAALELLDIGGNLEIVRHQQDPPSGAVVQALRDHAEDRMRSVSVRSTSGSIHLARNRSGNRATIKPKTLTRPNGWDAQNELPSW